MLKRTPLFAVHQQLGARLVEFGGWEMPVQYTGIVEEHRAVRQAAGLFDISHMGEVVASGPGAAEFLNHTLTNDVRKLLPGQGQYTLLCREDGGVVDDLYLYRIESDEFLMIINASRTEADWDWLQAQVDHAPTRDGFRLRQASAEFGALAVQGPAAAAFIDLAMPGGSMGCTLVPHASALKKNELGAFVFQGTSVYVARTGYTGEDGFEIVAPAAVIPPIWDAVMREGAPFGLKPAGLGARDTLRTEVCYPLYGHELTETTTPLEAGVAFAVALDKGDFVGREVLARQKAEGLSRRCVAFRMTAKSPPPRPHYPMWSTGAEAASVGTVSSGTLSPTLETGIGMGYLPARFAQPGTTIEIEIRGRRYPAQIEKKPLYRRPS